MEYSKWPNWGKNNFTRTKKEHFKWRSKYHLLQILRPLPAEKDEVRGTGETRTSLRNLGGRELIAADDPREFVKGLRTWVRERGPGFNTGWAFGYGSVPDPTWSVIPSGVGFFFFFFVKIVGRKRANLGIPAGN